MTELKFNPLVSKHLQLIPILLARYRQSIAPHNLHSIINLDQFHDSINSHGWLLFQKEQASIDTTQHAILHYKLCQFLTRMRSHQMLLTQCWEASNELTNIMVQQRGYLMLMLVLLLRWPISTSPKPLSLLLGITYKS